MRSLASFGRRAAAVGPVRRAVAAVSLLVRLFASLGERKELVGNLGLDRRALKWRPSCC